MSTPEHRALIRSRPSLSLSVIIEGSSAFEKGLSCKKGNPYPAGTLSYKWWRSGWLGALSHWKHDLRERRRLGDYAAWPQPRPSKPKGASGIR